MRRSRFMALLMAAPALFAAPYGIAAEPATSEPVMLEFRRACAGAVATEEELPGPGVTKPRLTPKYPPKLLPYPKDAPKLKERAVVEMLLLVNEEGYVVQAKVAKSSGSSVLDRLSLEQSGLWRLEPGRVNGQATCMWLSFTSYLTP